MSPTIIGAIVTILAIALPLFGIEFEQAKITEIVQAVVIIVAALLAWWERTHLQKAPLGEGDVTALGFKKVND